MFDEERVGAEVAAPLLDRFQSVLRSLGSAGFVGCLELAPEVPGCGTTSDEVSWHPKAYVPDRFEQVAKQTPESLALCFGSERLTYRELNDSVRRRTRELRAMGVRRELLTCIFLERSVDMVV